MGRKNPKNKIINQDVPITDLATIEAVIEPEDINKIAIRRGKVRDLFRMGYEPHQIVLILDKGIKVNKKLIKVPMSEQVVRSDIEYIRQEDAATDVDYLEKRAEFVDKLKFLYQQAVREYINGKGAIKNSFLNTALAVLNKLAEVEGVDNPDSADLNVNIDAKISKYSVEIQKLGEEDRNVLVTAISQILGKGGPEPIKGYEIPGEVSELPASTSNDEGVSGKS
jgi:hypothetical protein